jgi:putative addiction module killer protein
MCPLTYSCLKDTIEIQKGAPFMAVKVEEYKKEDGSRPYRKWFDNLSPAAAAKVTGVSTKLAGGNTSGLKAVGVGVAEWKLDWGGGVRVYVHQDGSTLVLLLGGSESKQGQQSEIDAAVALVEEYKKRKKAVSEKEKVKKTPAVNLVIRKVKTRKKR